MRTLLSLLAVGALTLSACATSRAAQAPEPDATEAAAPASAPAAQAALVPPGEAKIGDHTTCPVSGDKFVVSADSPKAEYQGKTYYFCCPHCPAEFLANPAKYVQANN